MNITNPRRVLFIGPSNSGVLGLLKALTGSQPIPRPLELGDTSSTNENTTNSNNDSTNPSSTTADNNDRTNASTSSTNCTTAGLTHTLSLTTKYYATTLPIWLDEPSSPSTWQKDFCLPEAAEVVRAIGAWVLVFRLGGTDAYKAQIRELIDAIGNVIEHAYLEEGGQQAWDGVLLGVSMGGDGMVRSSELPAAGEEEDEHEEWEGVCLENGFEYVDGLAASIGSGEKRGVDRVREALEANDWSTAAQDTFADDGGESEADAANVDQGTLGMRLETAEMSAEFARLKMELQDEDGGDDEGEAQQVEELEKMMRHLQAARDMSSHLPEAQRKKFAEKAVSDLLQDLS